MVKNKIEVRKEFESNLKSIFQSLNNSKEKTGTQMMAYSEQNIRQNLIAFILKSLIIFTLLYFFLTLSIGSLSASLSSSIVSELVQRKNSTGNWITVSIQGKGIIYALLEASNDPDLTYSLAKYYERIGDSSSALELAKLTLQINTDNKATEKEKQDNYLSFKENLLGAH